MLELLVELDRGDMHANANVAAAVLPALGKFPFLVISLPLQTRIHFTQRRPMPIFFKIR